MSKVESRVNPALWNPVTHNGCITITLPNNSTHITVRIWRERLEVEERRVWLRTLSVKRGKRWATFGHFGDDGQLRLWRHGLTEEHEALAHIVLDPAQAIQRGLEVMIQGRCRCCNRVLTVPESIMLGIGPVCLASRRLTATVARLRDLDDGQLLGEFRSWREAGDWRRARLALGFMNHPDLFSVARGQLRCAA